MAKENAYQRLLRARVASTIRSAEVAEVFTHQGTKGRVREILVSKLLRPFLPSDIGIGTGQIIDSYGSKPSSQIDIVLYDKSILPPFLSDQDTGIFPIECVLYTIEVKTTLNAKQLRVAHENARNLRNHFKYRLNLNDNEILKMEKLISVVFAFNSDLNGGGKSEVERYKGIYMTVPYINAICVVNKSYSYHNKKRWLTYKVEKEFDEILGFLSGILNTYARIGASRGKPRLGQYTMPYTDYFSAVNIDSKNTIEVKCKDCGLIGELTPDVGNINLTVKGRINAKEKCPSCGGSMASISGKYEFQGGELKNVTIKIVD